MNLKLLRICSREDWTAGVLLRTDLAKPEFLCATLEDEQRKVKVSGETRIPAGTYEILLRDEGRVTQRYFRKFPDMHHGMLHLQNVPGFKWIYIHIGNTDEDTSGCILVGNSMDYDKGMCLYSTNAYKHIYPLIASEILHGNQVFITIEDVA